jgi:hypothetical protein
MMDFMMAFPAKAHEIGNLQQQLPPFIFRLSGKEGLLVVHFLSWFGDSPEHTSLTKRMA